MALPAVAAPDSFGSYRILSRLGAGGMGVVYKAFDEKLQRTVALKFLAGEGQLSESDRKRLLREARAASALEHENIAAIHAVEEAPGGEFFIVMSFYEGENLAARMAHSPLSTDQAISVVRQLAQGLAHAHAHNIVHRDIKPSNVILCSHGVAKIVDFGLARVASDDETRSIGVSGTLPYMSPEQVAGKVVDHRTDIWSLGVVMYELLTRQHPFQGDNPASTVAAISRARPRPMQGVPEPLQAIVYRALAKRPEDRYQNCLEMLRDLRLYEASRAGATVTLDTGDLQRRIEGAGPAALRSLRQRVWWIAGVLLAITAFAVFLAIQTDPNLTFRDRTRRAVVDMTIPAAYESYEKGMDLVQHYYRKDALPQALQLLSNAVKADPKFALGYVGLAELWFRRYQLERDTKLLDEAIKQCNTAIALNPQLPEAHIMLVRVQLATGNQSLALTEAQQALELDPNNSDAHLALADVYAAQGRAAEAENEYQQGIALSPESWDAHHRLGTFYYTQRRFEEAAQQYRRELELVPDQVYARNNLAIMLKQLNRKDQAEAEYMKALQYQLVFPVYANLANLYYDQKRYQEAIDLTKRALRENQTNYIIWNNLATYYEAMGDKANAEEANEHVFALLQEQIKLTPRNADMRSDLALQFARRRRATEALANLRAALALQPRNPRVLQIAGDVYYLLGDSGKAARYLRESLRNGNTIEVLDRDPELKGFMTDARLRNRLETPEPVTKPTAAKKTAS